VRRLSKRVALVAALFALLGSGAVAVAAGGRGGPDPTFGTGGRVVVPLPDSIATGRFGPIAPTANGGFLVAYSAAAATGPSYDLIERFEADGALDPSFGEGGSATVPYEATALAEDSGGGVVFVDDGVIERLAPDGAPDKAFDQKVGYLAGSLHGKTIAIDPSGRILVGGHFLPGARYYAGQDDAAIVRLEPNGEPDRGFGQKGTAYVSAAYDSNEGEFGLLADGSMLMVGPSVTHIGADGKILASPKTKLGEGSNSIAVSPDGGFAVASFAREALEPREEVPGCTVRRYGADGSPNQAFATGGVFTAPDLAGCRLLAAPEGGLLVWGTTEVAPGQRSPRLIRLTAAGAPVAGFGDGGTVTVGIPTGEALRELSVSGGAAIGADGRIVVAGGTSSAILAGLEANGAPNPAFGSAGTVVKFHPIPSTTSVRSILAEPDGELLVAATTSSGGSGGHPIWMRFTAGGKLKPTVAGAPYLSVPSVGTELLADRRKGFYSIGYSRAPDGATVTRYSRAGKVVHGFATDGVARLPGTFKPSSAVVDRDGGVTVLGSLRQGRGMAAFRLTAGGSPDRGFGHGGLAAVRFAGPKGGRAFSGLGLPGGGVLLVGRGSERLALAELGPDGRPRRAFGHGGRLTCGCHGLPPETTKVVDDGGSFYVLSGWELGRKEAASVLVKVTRRGTIDRSFGRRGHQATDAGGPVALLARGRQLIVVGTRGFGRTPARVRAFGLDGASRPFGAGATVGAGPLRGQELAATLQPNGRLVLVGERPHAGGKGDGESGSSLELLGLR
jgi:uncharacterized delta-60 repeat protein